MRLLHAELTKLRRPLLWCIVVALVVFAVMMGWVGVRNASGQYLASMQTGSVADGQQVPSPQEGQQTEGTSVVEGALQHPIGIGALAAGMSASLPGALAVLLLAAGHVAQEWSGRTIKAVLTQEGRRWRVLAAKLVSLWLAAVGIMLVVWIALAVASFAFARYPIAGPRLSVAAGWRTAGPQLSRALLVLAVFVALGVVASVLTRNTLGAFSTAFGFLIGSMIVANFQPVTRGTLTYWVTGWMGYQVADTASFSVWPASVPYGVVPPSHQAGLYGLVGFLVLAVGLAYVQFTHSDVKA
jgi:ABC-type transport system involved in multi-copper enzyme maturation permease subunit